jgi:class 3 adenylate cyclase/tetratricopeptide (TPR) repeat protein
MIVLPMTPVAESIPITVSTEIAVIARHVESLTAWPSGRPALVARGSDQGRRTAFSPGLATSDVIANIGVSCDSVVFSPMADLFHAGEQPAGAAQVAVPRLGGRAGKKTWAVTILFVDVVHSTQLSEQLASEAYAGLMERFQQEGRRIVRGHGGFAKTAGDGIMGIFGVPVKGDDALQAVRVAVLLRGQVLPALNDEFYERWGVRIEVRIGVYTDEAPVRVPGGAPLGDLDRDDPVDVLGSVVNVAQRLESTAQHGQILIGQATYQRVRAWVTVDKPRMLELDGVDGPVPAWALFTVYRQPRLRLGTVPMVGRTEELSQLNLCYQRTRRSRRLNRAIVIGEAGIGKSRLVQEFVRGLGDQAKVLQGQCQQHGLQQHAEAAAYGPIMQMLQQAADIPPGLSADAVRARLRPLAGDDPHRAAQLASLLWVKDSAAEPTATLRALREALRLLARRQPLVLVIEDLEWAGETLLDLINDLTVSLQNEPILVVCTVRPGFLDDRPAWTWSSNAVVFEMGQLDDGEVEELVHHLLHEGKPDPELLRYIVARPDRSPLSIQLLVAVLEEDGFIALDGDRWRVQRELAGVGELPRTINVVRARLDRLSPPEQAALEGAAVIGNAFLESELYALVQGADRETIDGLARKNLLRPGRRLNGPEAEEEWAGLQQPAEDGHERNASAIPIAGADDEFYSFADPLVREAAYQRLSGEDRGRLHERYTDLLKTWFPTRSAPLQLLVGNHLDDAYRAYLQSGKPKSVLEPLALSAGTELAATAHQGVVRGGLTPTVQSVLRRAIELLPDGHERRLTAQLDLARTLLGEADLDAAAAIYQQVVRAARQGGNVLAEVAARLGELDMVAFNDPGRALQDGPGIVRRALEIYTGSDNPSLAKARYMSAHLDFMASHMQTASATAEQARREAKRAGDIRLEATIRWLECLVMFWGPAPVQQVLDRAEGAIAWAQRHGMYSLAAGAHNIVACTTAMQGRFDEARERNTLARKLRSDPGELLGLGSAVMSEGLVEWYAGELDTAEQILRQGWDQLVRRGGERGRLSVVALLARVLLEQPHGRDDEADVLTDRCQQEAAEAQLDIQIKWRQLRAILLARQRRLDQAEQLAREAMRLAQRSEQPDAQAQTHHDLAALLQQRGSLDDARTNARKAIDLYEAKGNLVSAGRAHRFINGLE